MIGWLIGIDRALFQWLNGSDSLLIDRLMLDITTWWVWIPLYLMHIILILKNNETVQRMSFAIGCALLCFLLTEISADLIIKPLVGRMRPFHDASLHTALADGYKASGYSFVSAHAANMFGLFVYIALLIRSRVLTTALLVWSLFACYSRIYLGVHYPADVFCGMLLGALVGWSCYRLNCRSQKRQVYRHTRFVSSNLTSSGYATDDIDRVISILLLSVVAILVHTVITA